MLRHFGNRQEDCLQFKASLKYIAHIRPARAAWQDCVKIIGRWMGWMDGWAIKQMHR